MECVCYINPNALSLPEVPPMLSNLEAELPVTIDNKHHPKLVVHGICAEDIKTAENRIKEYTRYKTQDVQVIAFQGIHFLKKYSEVATKVSCKLAISPSNYRSLPLRRPVTLAISGCNSKVQEVVDTIEQMSKQETMQERRIKKFKDEVTGLLLTQPGEHLSCLQKKATDNAVELKVLPKPELGFMIIGWPKAVTMFEDVIEEEHRTVIDKVIACRQMVLSPSYTPLLSHHEVLECRENLKKELKVVASFSSDKEQNVIAEAHLCVRQDRTVTIKIVKGKLSAQKVDAIVIPTGRSTATDYPIEYHNLATQSYQDGYSEVLHNPCRLVELGQTSILDGGKLPCQHIVHTLAPKHW